ncbi:MAG: hypothetical protein K2O54_06950, partial [Prevotella sp.]|nr:hypothetical protein [Prevotella sp.]
MSKPLTLNELRSLEVGDWVWVIYPLGSDGEYICKGYHSSDAHFEESPSYKAFCSEKRKFLYSTYGETWLAYKNKEESYGKYNGLEPIERVYRNDINECERLIMQADIKQYFAVKQARQEVAK